MSAGSQHPGTIEHMSVHLHTFYEAKGAPLSLPKETRYLDSRRGLSEDKKCRAATKTGDTHHFLLDPRSCRLSRPTCLIL